MGKQLNRLGFKVTSQFLEKNSFKKFICNEELVPLISLIKSFSKEVLKEEWRANNVLKLPYILNAINPAYMALKETDYDKDVIEFYCHESLEEEEVNKTIYLLGNNIEEFLEKYKADLLNYNSEINIKDIRVEPKYAGTVDYEFLLENLTLVKMLFIKVLDRKSIYIGTSEDEKYLKDGSKIQFFPSYSRQIGHLLISEIIDIDLNGKNEKMAFYIIPNIEIEDGEIYIYPMIGVKRVVTYNKVNALKDGTAKSYSTLIFDGSIYYSPRVKYCEKKGTSSKEVQLVSEDWKLYEYIKKYKGISFDDVKKHIESEDKEDIYLIYSTKMGGKNKLNPGVPGSDKLDIYNYILENIEGLEPLPVVDELKVGRQGAGALNNSDKIILSNTIYRSPKTDIDLLIIQPSESMLYEYTEDVIESGKLIQDNAGMTINANGSYSLELSDGKIVNLEIRKVVSTKGIEIKSDNETADIRAEKLLEDIGYLDETKLTLAFIDLENMGKLDAKKIIRNALDSRGIINQFINGNEGINDNKICSSLRDLFNDIGFGNANQTILENEVIYTLHKADKINFICRLDNNNIEVKIPAITNEYMHITDIYKYLPNLNSRLQEVGQVDDIAVNCLLKDIKDESREVLVILEGGETQYNSVLHYLNQNIIEEIKQNCMDLITTDLLGHQEIVQTNEGKITLGTGVYKVKEGTYISIGDKGQCQVTVEASKIRRWTNSHNKVSIGAKIQYQDRIAYKIITHNDKENQNLCNLVHKLRLSLTRHSHLNRCITTDYILGLEKNIKDNPYTNPEDTNV